MEVIFLTYANSTTNRLKSLEEEGKFVYDLLWRKARDRNFLPYYQPFSSIDQLNEMLQECDNQISVFVYSGHAGSNMVLLEDEFAHSNGIALHLRKSIQSGVLKLVVLNGCSTKGQVKTLLALGVPVVIATQGKVDDKTAFEFAKTFFTSLIQKEKNIFDSFQDGVASAQLASRFEFPEKQVRHLDYLEDFDESKPLWEIFANDQNSAQKKIIPALSRQLFNFRSNEKILKTIYTSFYNARNPSVVELWSLEKIKHVAKFEKESRICNSIPRLVGFQLQKLLQFEINEDGKHDFEKRRLFQLGQLYHSIDEFLAIIIISQLWEIQLYTKANDLDALILPPDIKDVLKEYYYLTSEKRNVYDYSGLVIKIRNFISTIISEGRFNEFLDKQEVVKDYIGIPEMEYLQVSRHLNTIRRRSFAVEDAKEITDLYTQGEDYLCELFNIISFIHKYHLKSVHLIETLKKRYEHRAKFKHSAIQLNQITNEPTEIIHANYLDSHGVVIILKDEIDKPLDFLNLSPFIIDRNVFDEKSDRSALFIFDEVVTKNNYRYKDIRDPVNIKISIQYSEYETRALNEKICTEFDVFSNDFLD